MKLRPTLIICFLLLGTLALHSFAALEPGNRIKLNLRGVHQAEQEKVSGDYRVGDTGKVRLPMLKAPLSAAGLTPEQFAEVAETAYVNEGIYKNPTIEVEALEGKDQDGPAVVSVGGQVRHAGAAPFRKGMTVIQALDAAGGRNEFGGRNVLLLREGKQYCLDFTALRHKNIILKPGDSLQVEQKGLMDRWKGSEASVKVLME